MTKYVKLERQRPLPRPKPVAPAAAPRPDLKRIYRAHAATFSPLMRAVLLLKIKFAS
tara:strand:+ start:1447 stop:1617 length:171 start_codon:yes stop_codon:yes gene_type:complete